MSEPLHAAEPIEELPSSEPGPMPAALIRFCRTCGSAWDPELDACVACAELQPQRSAAVQRQDESRSVFSAVWLYFSLLAVSFSMWIVRWAVAPRSSAGLIIAAEIAMSLLIVGWAIAQRDLLRGAFRRPNVGWLLVAVPIGGVTFLMAKFGLEFLHAELGLRVARTSSDFFGLPNPKLWAIATVCVQPALFEELGFRGVILPSLSRVLTTTEAITVTALMFGILHLSFLSLPHLIALGWLAGWLRTRSGSLYPAMILHFTHNLLVVMAEWHGGIKPW